MAEENVHFVERLDWRLEKFDGDPPKYPGEKEPVEVITGGDGVPTRRFIRNPVTKELEEDHGTNNGG